MKPLYNNIIAIVLTFMASAFLASPVFPAEGLKVSGYAFGDYFYIPQHHLDLGHPNGLWFRRGYLTFDVKGEEIFSRLRFEMNSPDSPLDPRSNPDTLKPYIKDLYLGYRFLPSQKVLLGVVPTPTWEKVEEEWGYRYLEKTPIDLYGKGSSRDLGLMVQGSLLQELFEYHAGLGNGEGAKSEVDQGKAAYLALGYRPATSLFLQLYGDYNDKAGIRGDRFTIQGFSRFQLGELKLLGLYAFQRVYGPPKQLFRVATLMLNYELFPRNTFVLRYDRTFDPISAEPGKPSPISYLRLFPDAPLHFLLLAWDLKVHEQVRFAPNLEWVRYTPSRLQGEKPKDDRIVRLSFFFQF